MKSLHARYIYLVNHYLGDRRSVAKALPHLEQVPELVDVHIGELTAAINLFDRYRQSEMLRRPELFISTERLMEMLGNENLPAWYEIQQKIVADHIEESCSEEFDLIFKEIGLFQFPDWDLPLFETLGTLFVSFYRTYTVVTRPHLRTTKASDDILIGSAIAEMLSLLALNGCKTHLFLAEKIWIVHHEGDWFAEELVEKVRSIK